jgi:hypothetical protein
VFFKWVKTAAAVVVVGGILAIALGGFFGWLGEPLPGPVGARLLAEGKAGDERWAVVLVETANGAKPHLRHRGVDVGVAAVRRDQVIDRQTRRVVPGQYEIDVVTLPGTVQPMLFGLLPAGTAHAEIVPDSRAGTAIPIKIKPRDGTAGPYVIETAPGSPASWQDRDSVIVHLYDDQGQPLLPK